MGDYGEYSNGADGTCQECGEETAEEWHVYCADCYAREQGWSRPARPKPGTPPESFVAGLAEVRAGLAEVRERLDRLEDLLEERYIFLMVRVARHEVRLEELDGRHEDGSAREEASR